MLMRTPFILVAALAGAAAFAQATADPATVRAGSYKLDKAHSKLNWGVSHFGFSTYSGEFTDFDAQLALDPRDPSRSKLEVTIAVASVETNDDRLDTHLRSADFFDAATHPTATFRSTRLERTSPTEATVTGDLTIRGTTRPATLRVNFVGAGINPVTKAYTVGFAATTTIRRTDFGVSAYAPAIGETVELRITGEFNPVAASGS